MPAAKTRDHVDDGRYDLIPPEALSALARTYGDGAAKYGDHNWRGGYPYSDVLNHVLQHLNRWHWGDDSEDHLAHAAWGLLTLITYEAEERRGELDDIHRIDAGAARLRRSADDLIGLTV